MSRPVFGSGPRNIKTKYCVMCEQVSNYIVMDDGTEICQECGYSNAKGPR